MEQWNSDCDDPSSSLHCSQLHSNMNSNSKPKKVHFAVAPVIYRAIPWIPNSKSTNINSELETIALFETHRFDLDNTLKHDFTQLRTPYNINNRPNILTIVASFFFFLLLFLIIWLTARKVLILEIEQQISNAFTNIYQHFIETISLK